MDGGSFRLLPLLHSNLQRLGVEGPEMTLLKGVRRRAWYQSQMMLREMMPIIEGWVDEGIPVTLLKGSAVAQLHYGDLSLRPFNDVDAMVPKEFVNSLLGRLVDSGWELLTWAPSHQSILPSLSTATSWPSMSSSLRSARVSSSRAYSRWRDR